MDVEREHGWEMETAGNLAFAWQGTDPMRSVDDVRKAVAAADVTVGGEPLTTPEIEAIVLRLTPKLRAAGMLLDA